MADEKNDQNDTLEVLPPEEQAKEALGEAYRDFDEARGDYEQAKENAKALKKVAEAKQDELNNIVAMIAGEADTPLFDGEGQDEDQDEGGSTTFFFNAKQEGAKRWADLT